MSKGAYNINEAEHNNCSRQRRDTSYKSFLCALLVFLALCLIISALLATIKLNNKAEDNNHFKKEVEEVSQTITEETINKNEKLILINAPLENTTTEKLIITTPKKITTETFIIVSNTADQNETINNTDHFTQLYKNNFEEESTTIAKNQLSSIKPSEINNEIPNNYNEIKTIKSTTEIIKKTESAQVNQSQMEISTVISKEQEIITEKNEMSITDEHHTTEKSIKISTEEAQRTEPGNTRIINGIKATETNFLFTTETSISETDLISSDDGDNANNETEEAIITTKFGINTSLTPSTTTTTTTTTTTMLTSPITPQTTTTTTTTMTMTPIIIKVKNETETTLPEKNQTETTAMFKEQTTIKTKNEINISEHQSTEESNEISTEETQVITVAGNIIKDTKISETNSDRITIIESSTAETDSTSSDDGWDDANTATGINETEETITKIGINTSVTPTTTSTTILPPSPPPPPPLLPLQKLTTTNTTTMSAATTTSTTLIPTTTATTKITTESIGTPSMITKIEITNKNKTISESDSISKYPVLCDNFACHSVASRILSLMKHSVDPCGDFYEFACGGGEVYHHDSVQKSADSMLKDILSKYLNGVYDNLSYPESFKSLGIFYDSCTDYELDFKYHERISNVINLLSSVGRFQFENQTTSPTYDITELFAKLILLQSMPLFDISLDVAQNNSNQVLQLTLPQQIKLQNGIDNWSALTQHKKDCLKAQRAKTFTHDLNLTEIYDSYLICQKDYARYLNSIENVVRDLGVFSELNSTQLLKEIKDIRFSIEFNILDLLNKSPDGIRSDYVYKPMKVSDLQRQFPFLNWNKFFEILTGRSIVDNNMTVVHVYFEEYFNKMFTHLKNLKPRLLNNALLAIYANDLYENTVIPKERENRQDYCMNLCKKLFPDVIAHLLKLVLPKDIVELQNKMVLNLFKILKKKFSESLEEAAWLDETSKIFVKNKLNKIKLALFHNDLFHSTENVNYFNETFLMMAEGKYQKNLINLLTHNRKTFFSLEGTETSEILIFNHLLNPLATKSLTFYEYEVIAVPYGLLQKTSNDLPGYIIMARIGLHLAREIARHFDPIGILHDMRLSPMSIETYNKFKLNSEDVLNYATPRMFIGRNISFPVNAALSNNERIAENIAYRLITDSFNDFGKKDLLPWINGSYTREEIFHIAVAQEYCKKSDIPEFMLKIFESEHLPSPLRLENIVQNSKQFSEAFNCAKGSGMNMLPNENQFPYLQYDDTYSTYNDDLTISYN